MTNLTGKRAIVSGASRGIGRSIAIALAKAGAEVVINYRSTAADADEVIARCAEVGGKAHKVRADFEIQSDVEQLVAQSVELMGGIDIAVSNAVYSDRRSFLASDLDEFRKTIDVSMWGAYFFLRAAAEEMVECGHRGKHGGDQQPSCAFGDSRIDGLQHGQGGE